MITIQRTELQKYIIKRQFIKNVKIITEPVKSKKYPRFQSSQPIVLIKEQQNFKLHLNTEIISNTLINPAFKFWFDETSHPDDFNSNALILVQYLIMYDVTVDQIIGGCIPEFEEVHLTPKFLEWDFPAIQEIVEAYLNDTKFSTKSPVKNSDYLFAENFTKGVVT